MRYSERESIRPGHDNDEVATSLTNPGEPLSATSML